MIADEVIAELSQQHQLVRRTRAVAWCVVAIHVLAGLGLLTVYRGTEANLSLEDRASWLTANSFLWITNWVTWMIASASLFVFCCCWSSLLIRCGASRFSIASACTLIGIGVVCDWLGETTLMRVPGASSTAVLAELFRRYQMLSPGTANGLYCVGGLLLSRLSYPRQLFGRPIELLGVVMWIIGLLLTAATFAGSTNGMKVFGGGVMILFTAWTTSIAFRLSWPGDETNGRPPHTSAVRFEQGPSNG